jgi:hypothetical protein
MDLEIARIAYEVTYKGAGKPELSFGSSHFTTPQGPVSNLTAPGRQPVYYLGGVEGTRLGLAMYRADAALGHLGFGSSADVQSVVQRIPSFRTLPELYPEKYASHPSEDRFLGSDARIFLRTESVELDASPDRHSLEFRDVGWTVDFGQVGPAEQAFAAFFGEHFEAIAATDVGAPLAELVPYAEAVSVFRWLEENAIAFDPRDLLQVPITPAFTPHDVPALGLPRLTEIDPPRPTTLFGPFGPSRIVFPDGKETTFEYVGGRLERIRRRDDAVFEIRRDGLGTPITARALPDLGLAFSIDKGLGPIVIDGVEIAGDESNAADPDAIAYPDTQWERTVDALAVRFALAGPAPSNALLKAALAGIASVIGILAFVLLRRAGYLPALRSRQA